MRALLSRLTRRLGFVSEPRHPPLPDWNAIASYSELASRADAFGWIDPDAFLAGPFRRFLDLCAVDDDAPRARARIMEFGRGALHGYAAQLGARGGDGAVMIARGVRLAYDRLRDAPDGAYMLDVLDGTATHNWRRADDDATG